MRTEAEIAAMRDQLERYSLSDGGATSRQLAAMRTLRWACDPLASDRDVIEPAGIHGEGSGDLTFVDLLVELSCHGKDDLDDKATRNYLASMGDLRRTELAAMARKLGQACEAFQ